MTDDAVLDDECSGRDGQVVSRMQENRTYGLKGGWGTGPMSALRP